MAMIFINCTPKEFYEELKPLLLTLEGYTMESDEWLPNDRGCLVDYEGSFYPHYQKAYEEVDLADFIEAVKPNQQLVCFGCGCPDPEKRFDHYWCRICHNEISLDRPTFAEVKPKPTVDLRGRFIPCTEEQVDEVCDLLEKLGCDTEGFTEPRVWMGWCTGVIVNYDLSYQTFRNYEVYPTLTIEELREMVKNVKV